MVFLIGGIFLVTLGGLVTVLFWVPRLVDRRKLRELMGRRYLAIYLVYSANGPVLLLAGILLLRRYFRG